MFEICREVSGAISTNMYTLLVREAFKHMQEKSHFECAFC